MTQDSKLQAQMPLYIDSTMLTCFRSCPEKMRLEFIYGLRPPGVSIDLHAGGCFATALEHYREGVFLHNMTPAQALEYAHGAFAVAWGDFEIPAHSKTAKTFDRTWAAVEAYFEKWPILTDHVQPYIANGKPTFEFTFAIPLEPCAQEDDHLVPPNGLHRHTYTSYDPAHHGNQFPLHPSGDPWCYSGRFDMLGQYQGLPVVEDDKTTGRSISTGWADQWTLRNQFLGYTWAAQQSGLAVERVVIRGIAILKTMINCEEAIKPYSQHLLATWHEQLRRDMWRLRQAWDTGYFDLNLADACTSYGNCMFMTACSSAHKEMWLNEFEVRRWNPLHKNPVDDATV